MTVADPYAALPAPAPPHYADPSRPDPLRGFRTVGGATRSLPPRVRLHSDDLLRLAGVDASDPKGNASIRGIMYRVADPAAPDREFADLMMAAPQEAALVPASYTNPCELRREPNRGAKVLDGNDRAWIDMLDETTLSDEDARILTAWHADVATLSERKLIERVLDPVRRRHDRAAEEAQLRPVVARGNRTVPCRDSGWRKAWEGLLGERMAEEAMVKLYPTLAGVASEPREKLIALAEQEAHEAAKVRLATLWADQDAQRRQAASAAATRLRELAAGADPATSAPAVPDDLADLELPAAHSRGVTWREARQPTTDPFAGFRRVGA